MNTFSVLGVKIKCMRVQMFFLGIFIFLIGVPSIHAQVLVSRVLEKLVGEVVAGHPMVFAKRAAVNEAVVGVDAAKSQYWPSPSIQVTQLSGGGNSTSVMLSQPLWTAGRLSAGLDGARARVRSADDAVLEAQNALALRVTDLYQSTLASRQRLVALQAGVDRLKELGDVMQRRVDGGVSASVDYDLGMARMAQARNDLAQEVAVGRVLLAQLGQLVGRRLDAGVIGVDESAFVAPSESEDVLIERALARHPTLTRASADIEVALLDVRRQRAALWPTLSLQVERKLNSQTSSLNLTQVYLALQYQPGAGWSGADQVRSLEARTVSLRAALESTQRDIVDGLQGDFERYRAARARAVYAQSAVDSSREVLISYRRLFVAGKRGWLDVVNAAREVTQSELVMADLSAALDVGPYRLKLRTGDVVWMR